MIPFHQTRRTLVLVVIAAVAAVLLSGCAMVVVVPSSEEQNVKTVQGVKNTYRAMGALFASGDNVTLCRDYLTAASQAALAQQFGSCPRVFKMEQAYVDLHGLNDYKHPNKPYNEKEPTGGSPEADRIRFQTEHAKTLQVKLAGNLASFVTADGHVHGTFVWQGGRWRDDVR